jgi:hypothetical protein|tara:strand:- start:6951 stop:7286 length:336 start_codon:yes stop_codon:yes gene_type:complete
VKIIISIFISLSCLFPQDSIQVTLNPCDDPLLELAGSLGIKSIPIKDIPRFKKMMKACDDQGGDKIIEQIIFQDWQRDYKKAKVMQAWTSTFSICVAIIYVYFMAGLILSS